MSEHAGQEGPTPDFIPGWFAPREGNPDPAVREAVRIPEVGDHFPVTFLRDTETVRNPRRPQRGFTIGRVSEPGHALFDLAVPPGYWIVRDGDGALHNWRDEDFKAKYRRTDEPWTPPVDRENMADVVSREAEAADRDSRAAAERPGIGDGWQGTEPAEGTRRKLIRDTIVRTSEEKLEGTGRSINTAALAANALELADEIESALLRDTILAEQIEEDRGQRNGIEGEDDDGRVHVSAGDGTSVGSLEVVLGAGDGVPYVSLVDLEHVFANLYEDITERQAKKQPAGGEEPTDEAPEPGAVEEVELDVSDLPGPVRSLLASIFGRGG